MRRIVGLVTACLFAGCVFASNDLVSQGVYRAEIAAPFDGPLRLSVSEESGTLVVAGRYRGMAGRGPLTPAVEVTLVAQDGTELAQVRASFVPHPTKRMSHADFRAEFSVIPPPGTRIRVSPNSPETETRPLAPTPE